ncbi:MAG: F0F1 ATP synthase subunit B [Oscillospiraceae bacterium]|nr:F0F1 ATP synthase subunit B [Oscillospiraceae bacterium]
MSGFESVVGVNFWTALFTFLNMVITFLLLKKFLFKPVKKMIDDRQAEIDRMYEEAESAKQDALSAEAEYAQKLKDAKQEASRILSQAQQDATAKGDEIIRDARQEASRLKEKAQEDIRLEQKKAVNQMKDEISGMAVAIAAKVAEKEIRQEDHEALIEKFIEELGDKA